MKITRGAYTDYFSANWYTSYFRASHGHDFRHCSTGLRLVWEEKPTYTIVDPVDSVWVTAVTSKSLSLSWTPSTKAVGYRIYKNETKATDDMIESKILYTTATNYTDTGLNAALDYDYCVVVYDGANEGRPSKRLQIKGTPNSLLWRHAGTAGDNANISQVTFTPLLNGMVLKAAINNLRDIFISLYSMNGKKVCSFDERKLSINGSGDQKQIAYTIKSKIIKGIYCVVIGGKTESGNTTTLSRLINFSAME
jgi:hypothetical protein